MEAAAMVEEAFQSSSSLKPEENDYNNNNDDDGLVEGETLKEALEKHAKSAAAAMRGESNDYDDETYTIVQRALQEVSSTLGEGLANSNTDEDMLSKNRHTVGGDQRDETALAAVSAIHSDSATRLRHHQRDMSDGCVLEIPGDDDEEDPLVCRICGKADDRPVLRFLPLDRDVAVLAVAPHIQTFSMDICLHIFCGKTASILPSVNQPDLEILTKAGIKNKHGIGQEVNAALARTRCAILAEEGVKEKHFYLVREFEANLAAVRHTHSFPFVPPSTMQTTTVMAARTPAAEAKVSDNGNGIIPHVTGPGLPSPHVFLPPNPVIPQLPQLGPSMLSSHPFSLPDPFTAGHFLGAPPFDPTLAGMSSTGSPTLEQLEAMVQQQQHLQHQLQHQHPSVFGGMPSLSPSPYPTKEMHHHKAGQTRNGAKVHCECGGTHLPTNTAKGVQSWRNHIMTKRHQKWLESHALSNANFMFGAV